MIELKNVCKTFETQSDTVEAVKNISLTVEDGDIYGIIGLSGAGKSNVLRLLEDMDFYCVDNMPTKMIPSLLSCAVQITLLWRGRLSLSIAGRAFLSTTQ